MRCYLASCRNPIRKRWPGRRDAPSWQGVSWLLVCRTKCTPRNGVVHSHIDCLPRLPSITSPTKLNTREVASCGGQGCTEAGSVRGSRRPSEHALATRAGPSADRHMAAAPQRPNVIAHCASVPMPYVCRPASHRYRQLMDEQAAPPAHLGQRAEPACLSNPQAPVLPSARHSPVLPTHLGQRVEPDGLVVGRHTRAGGHAAQAQDGRGSKDGGHLEWGHGVAPSYGMGLAGHEGHGTWHRPCRVAQQNGSSPSSTSCKTQVQQVHCITQAQHFKPACLHEQVSEHLHHALVVMLLQPGRVRPVV